MTAGAAAGALALLAGCTLGGRTGAAATARPTDSPPAGRQRLPPAPGELRRRHRVHTARLSRPGPHVRDPARPPRPGPGPAPTSGTRSGTCAPAGTTAGSTSGAPAPARNDVTVGPLIWRGVGTLADGDQQAHGVHNADGWHYRIDSQLHDTQAVTVTVGPELRARAGLQYGLASGMSPAPAAAFHGCPGAPTVFIGAFFVAGDGRACVPLGVRVGNRPAQRVVISFFDGRCSA
ncbi:hypothetical protein [Actinacidiphila sp. ITFR-21]|uniref:hypothetical protein n=1 Tax=Actinacidiphila sp. ITFR-21 TaxID=3075199 RepID=UPI002889FEC5|nr:hypothetical protein [Streptomyces sp. ITFR-21]WNI18631.1 hypothetical protein RLT57_25930 [Streptomyces sp. ITFR-21]